MNPVPESSSLLFPTPPHSLSSFIGDILECGTSSSSLSFREKEEEAVCVCSLEPDCRQEKRVQCLRPVDDEQESEVEKA